MNDRILWEDTGDTQVWFIRDGENMIIETITNVDAVLDANKSDQADFSRTSGLGDGVRVAHIPNDIWWDWYRQGIVDDKAAFHRRLNDSDYQHLRVNSLKL